MSETQPDAVNHAKTRVSAVLSDRLKDGFYGYLFTSFVINNWQQIFILFKSKKPIEETLHNLVSQPEFVWNSFWEPLIWGTAAAFVMPWFIAGYVQVASIAKSYITSAEKAANEKRDDQLKLKTQKRALNLIKITDEKAKIIEQTRNARANLTKVDTEIKEKSVQRMYFDQFLKDLNDVYKEAPTISTVSDFKDFFMVARRKGIFNQYQEFLVAQQANRIVIASETPEQTIDKTITQ